MTERQHFVKLILETGPDHFSRFREEPIPMHDGTDLIQLTATATVQELRFRYSPVGYQSDFHCSPNTQWAIILSGQLAIGLRDGTHRILGPGDHLWAEDMLPEGQTFDPEVHGHNSWLVGDEPLVTAFVSD